MSEGQRPLKTVVERVHPVGYGMWDVLECGHQIPFDGVRHEQRRCSQCPPEPPEWNPDQLELL